MRIWYVLLAAVMLAVVTPPSQLDGREDPAPVHIQAHRGAGIDRPENTLETFRYSWSIGVTPEADLRTTADGTIVCFHDANLRRIVSNADATQQARGVEDLTDAEVARLEVGAFRGSQYRGQRVPRLADVFADMQQHKDRWLYLDIKTADLDQLATMIREWDVADQVLFTTTHHRLIRDWKQRVPESMTLLWNGGREEALRKKLADVREADFAGITHLQIHVRVGDLDSDDPFTPSSAFLTTLGQELKQRGIVFQTLPWECDDPRAYSRLLRLGVESFATDYPEVSLQAVRDR